MVTNRKWSSISVRSYYQESNVIIANDYYQKMVNVCRLTYFEFALSPCCA